MRVLLVEDDPDIRSMLENHFSKVPDVTLEVAENGSRALGLPRAARQQYACGACHQQTRARRPNLHNH